MEAARVGKADAKAIQALADLDDLGIKWDSLREANYQALQAVRDQGYATIRDEVIIPALLVRQARREQLEKDIAEIKGNYPGCSITFDRSWESDILATIEEIKLLKRPVSNHMELASLVASVVI